MRLILNSISAELLDRMRLSDGYDESERDRTLHAMINIARLVSTGHGAASVYMDFLKLSSVKMEGGNYTAAFTTYKRLRKNISNRIRRPEDAATLLNQWMDAILVMAVKDEPKLSQQVARIMGSAVWPTAEENMVSFTRYLQAGEAMEQVGVKSEERQGTVQANLASRSIKAMAMRHDKKKKSMSGGSRSGHAEDEDRACLNCGERDHILKNCVRPRSKCDDCDGPHVTKMHREATRINEKISQRYGAVGEKNCKANYDRCMETAKSSPRAYFTEHEDGGSVVCQSETSYEGDVMRWNACGDFDRGINAYGGATIGASDSDDDQDVVGLLGRGGEFEVCTREQAKERMVLGCLGDVQVVSQRDLENKGLWTEREGKRKA
jgi:hypothetical protein